MTTTVAGTTGSPTGPGGTIVTFYSYKGGVGRTMAVANVAWILASAGRKVLVVDWDLEAPGLRSYLHPFFLDSDAATDIEGVVDMVQGYVSAAWYDPRADRADLRREFAAVDQRVIHLQLARHSGWGSIDFLGPGRQGGSYEATIASLPWSALYDNLRGRRFFQDMRANMLAGGYDYILVDSRTGLGDSASICTKLLPDVVVLGFTMNSQSIIGAANVVTDIENHLDRAIRVLPVPMRVEPGETEKLNISRERVRRCFPRLPRGLDEAGRNTYWGHVEIPYKSFYAYEEVLAAFAERPESTNGLLSPYEYLTNVITNGQVQSLKPLPEPERIQWLRAFERLVPMDVNTATVVAAPRGRVWAEWIRTELGNVHISVHDISAPPASADRTAPVRTAPGGVDGRDQEPVVIVLTQDLLDSSPWREYLRGLINARVSGDDATTVPRIVGIRVDTNEFREPFDLIAKVQLGMFTEQKARSTLLRQLGRTGPATTADPPPGGTRFPGSVPEIRTSLRVNPRFVGREEHLSRARDYLTWSRTRPLLPLALCGGRGHGKTEIAVEYAHRFASDYDLVWWVRASSAEAARDSLEQLLKAISEHPAAYGYRAKSWSAAADPVAEMLTDLVSDRLAKRWLLVYDDATDRAALGGLLPESGIYGHVLITTAEEAGWRNSAEIMRVDPFTPAEADTLMRKRIGYAEDDLIASVTRRLGYLPQAVDHAATWIVESGIEASEAVRHYLRLLDRAVEDLAAGRTDGVAPPILQSLLVSLDTLEKRSRPRLRFLELCAFLSTEGISMKLLKSRGMLEVLQQPDDNLPDSPDTTLPGGPDTGLIDRILQNVANELTLVRIGPRWESLSLPPVLCDLLRSRMRQAGTLEKRRTEILRVLAAFAPLDEPSDDPKDSERYAELQRHIKPSGAVSSLDDAVRRWLVHQTRYLLQSTTATKARDLGEGLLAYWAAAAPHRESDVLRLRLATHVSNAYRELSQFPEAIRLNNETHERQTAVFPSGHPHVWWTSGSLALDRRQTGKFRDAQRYDEEAFAGFRSQYGDDHLYTIIASYNLAHCLFFYGDVSAALKGALETFERARRVLGDERSQTWVSALSVGFLQRQMGELEDAKDRLQQARRFFNERSDKTRHLAYTDHLLATIFRLQGDYDTARKSDQDALDRYRTTSEYHPDRPEELTCELSLATDLSLLGEHDQAVALGRKVLAGYGRYREKLADQEELAGQTKEKHPFEYICMANLALYLRAKGRAERARENTGNARASFDEARELSWKAMTGLRSDDQVGEEHFFTLTAAVGHANSLVAVGEIEDARDLDRQTHDAFLRYYTPRYPDTKLAGENYRDSSARLSKAPDSAGSDRHEIPIEIPIP
ncbi:MULTISPECIES: FxSxx-COOH system tetratricopeptide repeat protein [unclassified Frankia]|uniref:FxSxx-COOH system tetratricopeptide repeat protein n=1 Tax=unclassified Frankia TaxID=2632575 RepID=UPI0020250AD1